MTNDIVIYSSSHCPYCTKAKTFLEIKGQKFKVIDITGDDAGWEAMAKATGGRETVPQIFINGKHIGGHDDMMKLNEKGELDKLLGIAS